ncbi:MAG TPA: tagatose-6-phosphate ketose isomerase [Steroidobacteraceae bacterium]|nr:tagatose-6-phosphate ketose isomerase [Steroidobacteraceae bacterium]
MNYFGLTPEEIETRGGQWTAREIVQQPGIWQEVEQLVRSDTGGVAAFLTPLLQRPDLRIVLTGAGTSSFIGECLAPALLKQYGRWVGAVATTDLVASPENYFVRGIPTLLVSFARSGNSPESKAAVELAANSLSECFHLVVTCNATGELYRRGIELPNARVLLLPEKSDDRGFAMTSSFSGMLLAAARFFKLPLAGAAVPAGSAPTLSLLESWLPRLQGLVAQRFERIVYLGANELKGLAREAALKMLELSDGRVVSIADTPLGFRHGPKTILNGRTLVVVLLSNDSHVRRYDLDLLAELRSDGIAGRVLALIARQGGTTGHPDDVLVPGLANASDLGLCLPFAVFAQSLAFMQSLSLGIRPDTPNAAGAVSRVVKGVSIYPLERKG